MFTCSESCVGHSHQRYHFGGPLLLLTGLPSPTALPSSAALVWPAEILPVYSLARENPGCLASNPHKLVEAGVPSNRISIESHRVEIQ